MKKIVILFVILVFVLCAFFGFKTAAKILPSNNGKTNPGPAESTGVLQQNFLLIHVDDRNKDDPKLISIWAAFYYPSNPPQLMFLPLYPAFDADVHSRLEKGFGLNSNKKINENFVSQINKLFDIQTSGYILSDDTAIGYSNQWLTGQEAVYTSLIATTDEEKILLRTTEQTTFQQFCQTISTGVANSYFSAVDWTLLLPDHFSTSIPFETIALITDQITRATTPVRCDVLTSE